MKPLVSILIPAYNCGPLLADTVKSALAQTWARKEIIIVNDGSRDETLSVAKSFESADVKVFSQENQGAAATRNRLASLAQGEFLQWLDADDLISPDKVSLQLAAAEKSGDKKLLWSSGWAYFYFRPRKANFVPTRLWENLEPLEWLLRKWENNLHMQTATWLVSRELTDAAGPWNTKLLGDDDGEYFFRVIRASRGVRFVPDAKVYYRVSGASSLSYIGRSDAKREAQLYGMELQIGYLRGLADDARVHKACVTYLQMWLTNFFPERMDLVARMKKIAAELGGELREPELTWKYVWIQKVFGWAAAPLQRDERPGADPLGSRDVPPRRPPDAVKFICHTNLSSKRGARNANTGATSGATASCFIFSRGATSWCATSRRWSA
jgi:glycosyltransferase involved in cell wall biosynthesis